MSDNNSARSGGIGFFGLLGVAFIVLKLMNIITWSWGWVLLPIYGPIILVLLILLVMFLIVMRK